MTATVRGTATLLQAFASGASVVQRGRANRERTEQLKRSIDIQEDELRHRIERDSSLSDDVAAANDLMIQRLEHDKNVATQRNTLAVAAQVLEGKRIANREAQTQLDNRRLDAESILRGEQYGDLSVEQMTKASAEGVADEPAIDAAILALEAIIQDKSREEKLLGEVGDIPARSKLAVSIARDMSQIIHLKGLKMENRRQKHIKELAEAEGGPVGKFLGKVIPPEVPTVAGKVGKAFLGLFGVDPEERKRKFEEGLRGKKKAFGVGAGVTEEEKVLQGAFGTGTGGQQSTLESILRG